MGRKKNIFKGMGLSDLYAEVHESSQVTRKEIMGLVSEMKGQFDISNPTESPVIVPLIKDCLALNVKNNESLVKLVDIIQKAELNSKVEEDFDDALANIRAITSDN